MGAKGTRGRPFKDDEIIEALEQSFGLVTPAAQRLGCNRSTINRRVEKSERVAQAMADAREAMLDRAELSLFGSVQASESWAVMFYLKTIGKGRGYVERQELTGGEGKELVPLSALRDLLHEQTAGSA